MEVYTLDGLRDFARGWLVLQSSGAPGLVQFAVKRACESAKSQQQTFPHGFRDHRMHQDWPNKLDGQSFYTH